MTKHFFKAQKRIRLGELNDEDKWLLNAPKAPRPSSEGKPEITPTKLFSQTDEVNKANREELSKLPGLKVNFCA
jgi:hypothetical protein